MLEGRTRECFSTEVSWLGDKLEDSCDEKRLMGKAKGDGRNRSSTEYLD